MGMGSLVPDEVDGWIGGESRIYDRQTIFDYINGGGELYLAYGFRQVLARQFTKPEQPIIIVDLFDMGSSEDAFGIFSFEREGRDIGIGQGSEYAAGLLRFWKGKFFLSILAERETPAAKQAAIKLAKAIAQAIEPIGSKPKMLGLLPKRNLLSTSLRYFHTYPCLNYHYFVADQNILLLDRGTNAVLARYRMGKDRGYLLLVNYPETKQAKKAFDSFVGTYLPEAEEAAIAKMENGKWTGGKAVANFVIIVFDAPTKKQAETLLQAVARKTEVEKP